MPKAPKPIQLTFINDCVFTAIRVYWVSNGAEQLYTTMSCGARHQQPAYAGHEWRVRSATDGALLGQVSAKSDSWVIISADGHVKVSKPGSPAKGKKWGKWKARAQPLGLTVMAYDCVSEEAVEMARDLITEMCRGCSPKLLGRLRDAEAQIGIIGVRQVTSDIPGFQHLKGGCVGNSGQDCDTTTRGSGGTDQQRMTTAGEENILMMETDWFPSESLLVHKFAHAVCNLGLDEAATKKLHSAYASALKKKKGYPEGSAIMSNEAEYFAQSTLAWFEASARVDGNGGVNTRPLLKSRDANMYKLLLSVFGDNPWRFPDTAPKQLAAPEVRVDADVEATVASPAKSVAATAGDTDAASVVERSKPSVFGRLMSKMSARKTAKA